MLCQISGSINFDGFRRFDAEDKPCRVWESLQLLASFLLWISFSSKSSISSVEICTTKTLVCAFEALNTSTSIIFYCSMWKIVQQRMWKLLVKAVNGNCHSRTVSRLMQLSTIVLVLKLLLDKLSFMSLCLNWTHKLCLKLTSIRHWAIDHHHFYYFHLTIPSVEKTIVGFKCVSKILAKEVEQQSKTFPKCYQNFVLNVKCRKKFLSQKCMPT